MNDYALIFNPKEIYDNSTDEATCGQAALANSRCSINCELGTLPSGQVENREIANTKRIISTLRSTYWGCCQCSHSQIHSLRVVSMPSYTQIHSVGVVPMLSYTQIHSLGVLSMVPYSDTPELGVVSMLPYFDTLTDGGDNTLIHSDSFTGGGVNALVYSNQHSPYIQ
jgi:hypothetical protein